MISMLIVMATITCLEWHEVIRFADADWIAGSVQESFGSESQRIRPKTGVSVDGAQQRDDHGVLRDVIAGQRAVLFPYRFKFQVKQR
jgi:hypothetical protein